MICFFIEEAVGNIDITFFVLILQLVTDNTKLSVKNKSGQFQLSGLPVREKSVNLFGGVWWQEFVMRTA